MNVLFGLPVGALLAKPWADPVGLFGLLRWYLPLSRLWAAANVAGVDVAQFREEIGVALPAFWSDSRLQGVLRRNDRARARGEDARHAWEMAIFDPAADGDPDQLDRQRRVAATAHLATRALFYPLLFPRRSPMVRWRIDDPKQVEGRLGPVLGDPRALYATPVDAGSLSVSRPFVKNGIREYWLGAPTPSARLRERIGSETLYARVIEPVEGATETLICGSAFASSSN